jgi:hypothetical protein
MLVALIVAFLLLPARSPAPPDNFFDSNVLRRPEFLAALREYLSR